MWCGWLFLVITTRTLKFVYYIFNFYHTLVSERNLMFYIKFSFQVYSFIIFGHVIHFELQQLLQNFVSVILVRERFPIHFWDLVNVRKSIWMIKKKVWEHWRSLFLQPIRCERWRHMCDWFKSITLCLMLFFTRSPLWWIQFNNYPERTPVDLAWVSLMFFNHFEFQFLHL